MATPQTPDAGTRDNIIAQLADLISRGGAERFLRTPVAPGEQMFPDLWAPSLSGVQLLLRRLAAHAELERTVVVIDRREHAPPTEKKPATRVEVKFVDKTSATFALGAIGTDDVVGTLAHEIGVAFAMLHRPEHHEPYRSQQADTLEPESGDDTRGSIATIYLGLGVVAANAAYQYYSWAGRFNGAYNPHEFEIIRAGHVTMSELAFALAVQAVIRDELPAGLSGPQRDEVSAWMAELDRDELCTRLGLARDVHALKRSAPIAFEDAELVDEDEPSRKTAFRWRTHRGGVGLIAGAAIGVGFAMFVASRGASPIFIFSGATGGHIVGRKVRVPRCSACATVVRPNETICPHCNAALRGDISSLSERLEAEERLDSENGARNI
ncbi:MAG: zinc ribbon domain-containing protein [Kofleriaceae bacterium]